MIDEATHSGTWDWNVKWDNIKPWLYIPWSVNVYFFSTSQKERKKKRDKLVFKSLITSKCVHYSRKKIEILDVEQDSPNADGKMAKTWESQEYVE